MAPTHQTLAGRNVPGWMGKALWLLVSLAFVALAWQALELQSPASTPVLDPTPEQVRAVTLEVPEATAPVATAAAATPRLLQIDRQMLHGDYVWNDEGVPAGRITIRINLAEQTLSVFRAGNEIGRAVILYGTEENPTPTGSFTIMEKDIDHESNIYDAIMPYMLRLTNDGIAIHGSNVRYGWASRGCVGVPDEFAALLFEQARIGDQVTIVAAETPRA